MLCELSGSAVSLTAIPKPHQKNINRDEHFEPISLDGDWQERGCWHAV
jgi:hypothetical protein